MSRDTKPHVLMVLDSAPEEPGTLNFFTMWVADLLSEIQPFCSLSLFYPVMSVTGSFYRLQYKEGGSIEHFFTYIPPKYASFSETFLNASMGAVFSALLKERIFSLVHILSLRNHSLEYPAIAHTAGLPVVLTVSDGWLRHSLRYHCNGTFPANPIKLSNFVASPFSLLFQSIEDRLRRHRRSWWFEEVGRYSSFYNRGTFSPVDQETLQRRETAVTEMIPYIHTFHFPSPILYHACYEGIVPSNRLFFMPQGIPISRILDNRPFDIQRGLSFGFIGDIIPEEGIEEMIDAFSIIHERGLPSSLHLYGEIRSNEDYIRRLMRRVQSRSVVFHGTIDHRRMRAVIDAIDVLLMPARWPRPDSWLAGQVMARRKAVVASNETAAADLIKKNHRGVVLEKKNASEIAEVVTDLEIDRRKAYYFMRIAEGNQLVSIRSNAEDLYALYLSILQQYSWEQEEKTTLFRKLGRKRKVRARRNP